MPKSKITFPAELLSTQTLHGKRGKQITGPSIHRALLELEKNWQATNHPNCATDLIRIAEQALEWNGKSRRNVKALKTFISAHQAQAEQEQAENQIDTQTYQVMQEMLTTIERSTSQRNLVRPPTPYPRATIGLLNHCDKEDSGTENEEEQEENHASNSEITPLETPELIHAEKVTPQNPSLLSRATSNLYYALTTGFGFWATKTAQNELPEERTAQPVMQ